ncbi:hypothetical protein ERIC1_10p00190 (plasmid) [Paenibacillus larvae subsp. larvae DSM 25719]|nr:hypothetical protein ERIC1_10p00190 [Paenibacillus larvae subsp. larvae DSM 25719]
MSTLEIISIVFLVSLVFWMVSCLLYISIRLMLWLLYCSIRA